jgi:hypothetical protein
MTITEVAPGGWQTHRLERLRNHSFDFNGCSQNSDSYFCISFNGYKL